MSTVLFALIVLATAAVVSLLVSALVSIILNGKHRQFERTEDLADRLDVKTTLEVQSDRTAFWAKRTGEQLQEIHTLVNSQLTESKESDLRSARLSLILAKRIIDRAERDGVQPSQEDLSTIRATQEKVENLEVVLKERALQQEKVDAQAARGEASLVEEARD